MQAATLDIFEIRSLLCVVLFKGHELRIFEYYHNLVLRLILNFVVISLLSITLNVSRAVNFIKNVFYRNLWEDSVDK